MHIFVFVSPDYRDPAKGLRFSTSEVTYEHQTHVIPYPQKKKIDSF